MYSVECVNADLVIGLTSRIRPSSRLDQLALHHARLESGNPSNYFLHGTTAVREDSTNSHRGLSSEQWGGTGLIPSDGSKHTFTKVTVTSRADGTFSPKLLKLYVGACGAGVSDRRR